MYNFYQSHNNYPWPLNLNVIKNVTIKNCLYICTAMNNTRFATAIHILTLLADNDADWLSSDWIGGSININPVMVRKELKVLNDAGLVVSRKGKEGGTKLNLPSDKITLAQVYSAVKNSEVLGKKNLNPNPYCPIGKDINENLNGLFKEVDEQVMKELEKKTIKDFLKLFH